MTTGWSIAPHTAAEGGRIVVGYDGSAASSNAVDWAALEAAARGWPLWIIVSSAPNSVGLSDAVRRLADRLRGNLGISVTATQRSSTEPLTEGVTTDDLFVLGPAPPNSPSPSLQRSVPPTASRRSPCPVVMVRGSFTRRIRRILLGVDGSSAAEAAIEWACAEAMTHDAEVLVAHVGESSTAADESNRVLGDALDRCRHSIGPAAIELSEQGSPRSLLLGLSRYRDLVVVGSRGRSGFKTPLFGSVATALAEHAFCPVVITHPQPKRDLQECSDDSNSV